MHRPEHVITSFSESASTNLKLAKCKLFAILWFLEALSWSLLSQIECCQLQRYNLLSEHIVTGSLFYLQKLTFRQSIRVEFQ